MAHGLPAADTTPLARSPLLLVVCQLRFEETLAVGDGRLALAMHKDLGGHDGPYPKLEAVKGARLDIPVDLGGQVGRPTESTFAGWRMSSTGGWVVTLMPDSVSLETTRYTTWTDEFSPRLGRLLETVVKHIDPATEQRLGLRYVDRISEPPVTSPLQWRGLIADEFLGPILHPALGGLVHGSQQLLLLDLGDGVRAIVRSAYIRDPQATEGLAFVLDFDVFREGVRALNLQDIKVGAEEFHDVNVRLFQQVATGDLREQLKHEARVAHGR